MAKHFKTPEGDAGRESTGRFEPLSAQTTPPHRRSWDDAADVTASGPAAGGDHQRRGDLELRDLLHGAGGALPQRAAGVLWRAGAAAAHGRHRHVHGDHGLRRRRPAAHREDDADLSGGEVTGVRGRGLFPSPDGPKWVVSGFLWFGDWFRGTIFLVAQRHGIARERSNLALRG